MKYGIVGSRTRKDKASITAFVNTLQPSDVVISGGCRGVDTWAITAARKRNIATIEYRPNLTDCKARWEFTKAYHARNERIARECDVLVAFVAPSRTGGTENTIKHAAKLGKSIYLR